MDFKKVSLALLVVGLLLATACTIASSISDVKTNENVGKTVTVTGDVASSFKLGSLSGFILKDDSGQIGVSSDTLPADNSTVTVTGVLMKDTLFGYYIQEK